MEPTEESSSAVVERTGDIMVRVHPTNPMDFIHMTGGRMMLRTWLFQFLGDQCHLRFGKTIIATTMPKYGNSFFEIGEASCRYVAQTLQTIGRLGNIEDNVSKQRQYDYTHGVDCEKRATILAENQAALTTALSQVVQMHDEDHTRGGNGSHSTRRKICRNAVDAMTSSFNIVQTLQVVANNDDEGSDDEWGFRYGVMQIDANALLRVYGAIELWLWAVDFLYRLDFSHCAVGNLFCYIVPLYIYWCEF